MSDKSYLKTAFPLCMTWDKAIYMINLEEVLLKITSCNKKAIKYEEISPYVGAINAEKVIQLLQKGYLPHEHYTQWSHLFPENDFQAFICTHPFPRFLSHELLASLPPKTIDSLIEPIPFQELHPGDIIVGEGQMYTAPIKEILGYRRWNL